ncbi:uncharacterized protein B0H64DRAFT_381540 [Chaetomium fimeti]|uniref:Uncharacterized protein n=1 Tax=Chaetomium fimeti TaxID=1854472 RepID=A0AAE0HQB7_9PEZI|nr:hypothetical protein B0H64DRAFT_381540 [Chaetomium fimeti]
MAKHAAFVTLLAFDLTLMISGPSGRVIGYLGKRTGLSATSSPQVPGQSPHGLWPRGSATRLGKGILVLCWQSGKALVAGLFDILRLASRYVGPQWHQSFARLCSEGSHH